MPQGCLSTGDSIICRSWKVNFSQLHKHRVLLYMRAALKISITTRLQGIFVLLDHETVHTTRHSNTSELTQESRAYGEWCRAGHGPESFRIFSTHKMKSWNLWERRCWQRKILQCWGVWLIYLQSWNV